MSLSIEYFLEFKCLLGPLHGQVFYRWKSLSWADSCGNFWSRAAATAATSLPLPPPSASQDSSTSTLQVLGWPGIEVFLCHLVMKSTRLVLVLLKGTHNDFTYCPQTVLSETGVWQSISGFKTRIEGAHSTNSLLPFYSIMVLSRIIF